MIRGARTIVELLAGIGRSGGRRMFITDGANLGGGCERAVVRRGSAASTGTTVRASRTRRRRWSRSASGRRRKWPSSAKTAAGRALMATGGRRRRILQLRQGVRRGVGVGATHLGRAGGSAYAGIREGSARLLTRAGLRSNAMNTSAIARLNSVGRRGLALRLQLIDAAVPVRDLAGRRGRLRRRTNRSWSTPLGSRWCTHTGCLVCLGMDILRLRCRAVVLLSRARQLTLQQLQTSLDVDIGRIKIRSASVSVECVGNLVVARFVLARSQTCELRECGWKGDSPKYPGHTRPRKCKDSSG